MQKLTQKLFLIADMVVVASIIIGVFAFGRLFFNLLSATFSPGETTILLTTSVRMAWGLFLVATVATAVGLFGYYLLLKRQILGLAIVAILTIAGAFVDLGDLRLYLYLSGAQLFLLALPWLIVHIDLRRNARDEAA